MSSPIGRSWVAKAMGYLIGLIAAACSNLAVAQDSDFVSRTGRIVEPPKCFGSGSRQLKCTAKEHDAWLADIRSWRALRRQYLAYDDARYRDPRTRWTQNSFIQTQVGVEDRYLFDVATGKYTVDRYLADVKRRFGGIDSVLIWPFYPNSGVDARNQMDVIASMPGGIEGVRSLVADFHKRGVKVLFPMMMWDQGTRDPGRPWPDEIAATMKAVGADGVNGDTFTGVPIPFSLAADRIGHPLAFEPELQFDDNMLANNLMSWGSYDYGRIPRIDRAKWMEPRHMVHVNDRWAHNKTDHVHTAFLMGAGFEPWENVWGIWNGVTPRDGELIRRFAAISRYAAINLTSPDWEPYYPTEHAGVYASMWPAATRTVWTLVNRTEFSSEGIQIGVPGRPGRRYFDLFRGTEIVPETRDGRDWLSFAIEPLGIGAVAAFDGAPDGESLKFLHTMSDMTQQPLASFDAIWKPLGQTITDVQPTSRYAKAPDGMADIPAARFRFRVEGVQIEEDNLYVDVQYPWESSPRRGHLRDMDIARFYLDRLPVTNGQFAKFVREAKYRPSDTGSFVKHWRSGEPAPGTANQPVTWVSIEDAREYCRSAGKRLPREWEWQYAAQGTAGSTYPWGNDWRDDAVPRPDRSRAPRAPDDVGTHPAGASGFGVQDMVGLVWQWTDEFFDEHSRGAIVRGGSYYQPQGSRWYFPQAYRNDQHNRLLLMAPSKDRSAMIGFRCAADAG